MDVLWLLGISILKFGYFCLYGKKKINWINLRGKVFFLKRLKYIYLYIVIVLVFSEVWILFWWLK